MKPELWLNRADHELALAKELLGAGSLLWASSYAHRSAEYALEGLIVLKTGERPERGSRFGALSGLAALYLPEGIRPLVEDLNTMSPYAWQSEIRQEDIRFLTEKRAKSYIEGAQQVLTWIGKEWDRCTGSEIP